MQYDNILDEYICHNQKRLKYIFTKTSKSKSGYESDAKVYECGDCEDCEYKKQCTKAKGNKRMQVATVFVEKRDI
jgi:hypothetical protein